MNNRHFNIKVLTSLALSGLILTLLITCEKPERIASIKTVDAADSDISYTSAILKGDLVDLGSEPIEDHGIIVSENASYLDPVPKSGTANPKKGVFQIEFTGLIKNTAYYYKAYVTVKSDQIYGESKNFKTKDTEAPTVTAGTVTSLTMTSASLNGEVTSDGGETTVIRGICWDSLPNPIISDCIDTTINSSGPGAFTGSMTGLTPGTQYYARTYATNSKGTSYNSADVLFTTHDIPEVTTTDVTDITKMSAASGGNVVDDGGVDVTARGVCWDTSTGPTVDLATKTNDGTGTGAFTSEITGLTEGAQYYLRAYATNQYGTSYGTEKSFTALSTAPGVVTGSATSVTTTSATLNGTVNANGYSTTATFEYGLTTSYGLEVTADQSPVTGSTATAVSTDLTGLSESTTYHYRVKAVSSGGTSYGDDMEFTTSATTLPPSATTGSATSVTSATATLSGIVNANNLSTTVTFEYGLTAAYGSEITAAESPVTGSVSTSVTASISSLTASTTYHYRVKAVSTGGTTYGDDMEFTTSATTQPPSATSGSATSVTTTSATLNGTVNANDLSTTVTFEYGLTTTYGSEVTAAESPVTGTTSTSVSTAISSLTSSTTYHYRVKAVSTGGTSYGDDMTFTTLTPPSAITISAGAVATTSALLQGTVNANGLSTSVTFEYGLTTSYGIEITADQSPVTGSTETAVNVGVTGLSEGTTYHYRVKAVSTGGTTYGDDMEFTTVSALPTVMDYDDNEYNIITIGTQDWIQENLKTTHFNNGDEVVNITDNTAWSALTSGAYCWYDNDEGTYKDTYGALYNWYTTVDVRNVCPAGWHVPTDDEWTFLTDYLGGSSEAGGKLKETGTTHWESPNDGATNETGFTALPGGYRFNDGTFNNIGDAGYWWSSTEESFFDAWERYMGSSYSMVVRTSSIKEIGLSVRCVKGELPLAQTEEATAIAASSAILNAQVNPNDATTTLTFEYGLTTSYGSEISDWGGPATGSTPVDVSYNLTGLTATTTYHYRIKAVNTGGTTYGSDMTFTTLQLPDATTGSATSITASTATLEGSVNANDLSTTVTFEYGLTTSYGSEITAAESPVTGSTATAVSADLSSLTASTTYHYRVKAVSAGGITYGDDMTLVTLTPPTATTGPATSVTSTSATLEGTVNASGLSTTVTFEYGTSTAYGTEVIADQSPVTGSTDASVSKSISGISASSTYHYRVKAISAGGTTYGDDMMFTTLDLNTISDYDGNVYNVVTIDTREWIKENLKTTHYSNSDEITNITDNIAWSNLISGAYSWYDNNSATYKDIYGALYNSYATLDVRNICPTGWHVSTDADWTALTDYLGGEAVAGGKLKEAGAAHWTSPNTDATDEVGFTALPGGYRLTDGTFNVINNYGYLWSSTESASTTAWSRSMYYLNGNVNRGSTNKKFGFSVRCVKGPLPIARTDIATGASTTSITLNGAVNPNSASTTVTFEYGLTTLYGSTVTAIQSPVSGSVPITVSADLTSLTPGTTYHYRIKAENSGGTNYGSDVVFETDPVTVSDIDGNLYDVVRIGNQIWMAENLKVTKYPDGTPILDVYPIITYTGGYRWYEADHNSDSFIDSDDSLYYVNNYGFLYSWEAIMRGYSSSNENPSGVQGVCPDGWHLPSDAEWTELELNVGSEPGTKLKEGGITGFNAKLGGFHYGVEASVYWNLFGIQGDYWTSTIWSGDEPYDRIFSVGSSGIGNSTNTARAYKWNHKSVRCAKDP